MHSPNSRVERGLERFRPVLLSLAEASISPVFRGSLEASDLVQQTLLEAHQNADLLSTLGDGPFFQWLRKALQHNVLDAVKQLRSQKNDITRLVRTPALESSLTRLEEVLDAEETSPSEIIQRNEQISLMLAALQELPENQKTAIILKHLRGRRLKDVAQTLGLSESATAGLLHRGRQKLMRLLENQCDG